ncbi:hypothetical protein [Cylindrospermopsis raciborskii]|uniref:thermonuclease family protein n=1 Tax=Cylindrospermopsis raciborskii TaxID=77022 RepID=UPI0022CC8684|nr:hypothetical protein [Cylindrospermopsis raciborskii]MCZ2203261.1 hypothetical protein [Cylindrospermopsis raciborskii PAMP2012]MCZ2207180.1 hypothetical protein [Cylindrospermopsis raciborskii PAMP2011]
MNVIRMSYFVISFFVTIAVLLKLLEEPVFNKWEIIGFLGDKIEVSSGNTRRKFKLCGIEVPALFTERSREYAQHIMGRGIKSVRLVESSNKSVEVFLGKENTFLNKEILIMGLAKRNGDQCQHGTILQTAEEIAKWQKIGIWSTKNQN